MHRALGSRGDRAAAAAAEPRGQCLASGRVLFSLGYLSTWRCSKVSQMSEVKLMSLVPLVSWVPLVSQVLLLSWVTHLSCCLGNDCRSRHKCHGCHYSREPLLPSVLMLLRVSIMGMPGILFATLFMGPAGIRCCWCLGSPYWHGFAALARPLLSLVLLVSQVVLLSFVPLESQMLLLPRVSWVQLLSQLRVSCGCHECCWFLGATLVLGATGVSAVGVMSAALVLGPTGGSVAILALGAALATSVTGAAALAVSVTGPAGVSCSTLVLGAAGAQVPLMSQVLPVSWVPLGSHVPSCPGCPGVLGAAFVLGAILAIGAFLATSVTDVASVSGSEARALRSQRSESVKCANLPCTEFLMAPVDVTSKGHLFQKELVGKCREGPASSHKMSSRQGRDTKSLDPLKDLFVSED
ncbi:hypothetical protein MJT46_004516 [Ovis ammon polii x Ovis aries]|nr:hypothetical protein MJT46_004516 [Ovis ammon polii x Ovis aries]